MRFNVHNWLDMSNQTTKWCKDCGALFIDGDILLPTEYQTCGKSKR